MKKCIALTILLLVLLLPFSVLADTGVILDDTISTYDGQSTIRWTSTGDVPAGGFYVIGEAINSRESNSLMQLAGNTSMNSLTTGLLAPDNTYRVYVVDSNFNIFDSHDYVMPSVPDFQDGNLKNNHIIISMEFRQSDINGKYKRIKSFDSTEMNAIAAGGSDFSCMKYQMKMPLLAYARNFYVQLVFKSPNGYTFTDKACDISFDKVDGANQIVWWDYAGADFFKSLYEQTGSIPRGQYTAYLYWDGYFVNATTFNVN